MRRAFELVLASTFLSLICVDTAIARDCPEGHYKNKLGFPRCLPNSSTVANQVEKAANPLPDILKTVNGAISGDVNQLSQGIGGLVIKGSCMGCDVLAQNILNKKDKAFVERVVGRGFLLYINGVDPVIILADAATSVAKEYSLPKPAENPLAPKPSAKRGVKNYEASKAVCVVVAEDGKKVTVGWSESPQLTGGKPNQTSTYPNVDIKPGDVVTVSTSDDCADLPSGQKAIKSAKFVYSYSSVLPSADSETVMKYFFVGTL